MENAIIHIRGQVAEVMTNSGTMQAKVVCDTDNLLISLEHPGPIELGSKVMIEGEIRIRSIQFGKMEGDWKDLDIAGKVGP